MKTFKNLKLNEENIWSDPKQKDVGYWSNLDKKDTEEFLGKVDKIGTLSAVRDKYPALEEVIYAKKRASGLELLNLKGDESCVDLGCMWGALTIPLAKMTKEVTGIDQTTSSLKNPVGLKLQAVASRHPVKTQTPSSVSVASELKLRAFTFVQPLISNSSQTKSLSISLMH